MASSKKTKGDILNEIDDLRRSLSNLENTVEAMDDDEDSEAHDACRSIVDMFKNPYKLPPHDSDWETIAREMLRLAELGL